ncbi:MAG: histone deacetylase family protein [Solirubrobacteraceae bacterium]
MSATPVLLSHPSSLEHETGAHPEQSGRIAAISAELEGRGWLGWERVASPAVQVETLTAVHTARHVELVRRAAGAGGAQLDPDTVVSAGSYTAALHACGGAVALVDLLLSGSAPTGFSVARPPGHHADVGAAMGFCLFNNVAVATRHALQAHGLERVMVLDWDVHHGNGTNDIFHDDPRVLFVSIHQSPLYPGTGAASDVGSGSGRGFTVNLPVAPGSGDEVFVSLVAHVALALAGLFAPQLVLISAGFDAHGEDPLAQCSVTEAGFAAMASAVVGLGDSVGVPFGAVLEGGYALGALARSVAATMEALGGGGGAAAAGAGGAGDALPVAEESELALARLAAFWPGLA